MKQVFPFPPSLRLLGLLEVEGTIVSLAEEGGITHMLIQLDKVMTSTTGDHLLSTKGEVLAEVKLDL